MSSGGATLQGSYSGETGSITETGFYYGTTSGSLGSKVAALGVSSPFQKVLSNLTSNTTYFYKAYVVESEQERVAENEASFRTKALATATVTTVAAGSITHTSATLNGSYYGATGTVRKVGFKYGTSSGNLNQDTYTNGNTTPFSKSITGLTAGTTYYCQAYVVEDNENTGGTEVRTGSILSFTTTSDSPAANVNANTLNHGYIKAFEVPAISGVSHSRTGSYEDQSDKATSDKIDIWHRYNTSSSKQKVATHTFSYNSKRNRTFTLLQDYDKKCAMWVAFAMHASEFPWLVDRDDSWKADPAFTDDGLSDWQPNLTSAYQNGSTYSRGHQCASNDRRTTTAQTHQTNYFTNMTPQLSGFNGGVWATLEGKVQSIGQATTGRDTLYVVTGPLFQNSTVETNPDKDGMECAIPTHYYKCLMKVSFDNSGNPVSAVGCAYLMVHQNGAAQQVKTIDYMEALTGFDFFANVPDSIEDTAEAMTYSFW